jgi:hypothetical protein
MVAAVLVIFIVFSVFVDFALGAGVLNSRKGIIALADGPLPAQLQ